MRWFLKLAYNGTRFHGWQRQPNAASVQETIEKALSTIFQRNVEITGAGRTDTGVHAGEMFAHFDTEDNSFEKDRLLRSLNYMCGRDIAIYDVFPVKPDSHARFDALSRTYRYYLSTQKSPFGYELCHFVPVMPDVKAMNQAAAILLEESDFTSFAKLHTDNKTNICNVTEAGFVINTEGKLVFTITADRFLRNMVRSIVGTLLMVGSGKIGIEDFKRIIDCRDRCKAGTSAPACGLFLEKIEYPENIYL